MQNQMKSMVIERMGKPLDARLWEDKDYMESRKRYHILMENMKKTLGDSQEGLHLVLELDEIFGEYSGHYGEVAYVHGFHDGLEIGLAQEHCVARNRVWRIRKWMTVKAITGRCNDECKTSIRIGTL